MIKLIVVVVVVVVLVMILVMYHTNFYFIFYVYHLDAFGYKDHITFLNDTFPVILVSNDLNMD